jgi:hypothetical protein
MISRTNPAHTNKNILAISGMKVLSSNILTNQDYVMIIIKQIPLRKLCV